MDYKFALLLVMPSEAGSNGKKPSRTFKTFGKVKTHKQKRAEGISALSTENC